MCTIVQQCAHERVDWALLSVPSLRHGRLFSRTVTATVGLRAYAQAVGRRNQERLEELLRARAGRLGLRNEFFAASLGDLKEFDMAAGPRGFRRPSERRSFMRIVRNANVEFAVVATNGIEPVAALSSLQSILSGEDLAWLRATAPGRLGDDGGPWLVPLRNGLRDALARCDEAGLHQVALTWVQTEELRDNDPERTSLFLAALARLARTAREKSHDLYCWTRP